jgi:hypothetical protein
MEQPGPSEAIVAGCSVLVRAQRSAPKAGKSWGKRAPHSALRAGRARATHRPSCSLPSGLLVAGKAIPVGYVGGAAPPRRSSLLLLQPTAYSPQPTAHSLLQPTACSLQLQPATTRCGGQFFNGFLRT